MAEIRATSCQPDSRRDDSDGRETTHDWRPDPAPKSAKPRIHDSARTTALCLAAALTASPALADPCDAPLPKRGQVFSGPVRYVGDGDSLCVAGPSGLIEVRVADFYAPELHDAGGREAKRAMERIAMGRTIVCKAGKRSFDRVVARCTLRGVSLGDLMRGAGIKEGGRGR